MVLLIHYQCVIHHLVLSNSSFVSFHHLSLCFPCAIDSLASSTSDINAEATESLLTGPQQMDAYTVLHESDKQHSEAQMEAVRLAAAAPIMLLTGAAGCGKTFTTKSIVKLWRLRVR
jgi:hypothetical protein